MNRLNLTWEMLGAFHPTIIQGDVTPDVEEGHVSEEQTGEEEGDEEVGDKETSL